jgi:hypothetical protein
MSYQLFTVLPYWFKTTVMRKKGLPEPKLYHFHSDSTTLEMENKKA